MVTLSGAGDLFTPHGVCDGVMAYEYAVTALVALDRMGCDDFYGVGDVARTAGKVANKGALATYASAKKLNEEYELTEKAKAKAVELVKQATEKLKQSLKQ